MGLRTLELFAGAGGGGLGHLLLGHRPICYVEIEEYPRAVLRKRIADGYLPDAPIWDDVRSFDGYQWSGIVDVVSGGFPCQDISAAGKGAGLAGERSGLWAEMARIVREVRPRFVWVENSPMLTSRGLGVVLGDLASLGYDAEWGVLGARDVGAPHRRDRIWILAYLPDSNSESIWEQPKRIVRSKSPSELACYGEEGHVADADSQRELQPERSIGKERRWAGDCCGSQSFKSISNTQIVRREKGRLSSQAGEKVSCAGIYCNDGAREGWWDRDPAEGTTEPIVGRVVDGLADRVDRLAALGNGQVPAVVRNAWDALYRRSKQ